MDAVLFKSEKVVLDGGEAQADGRLMQVAVPYGEVGEPRLGKERVLVEADLKVAAVFTGAEFGDEADRTVVAFSQRASELAGVTFAPMAVVAVRGFSGHR